MRLPLIITLAFLFAAKGATAHCAQLGGAPDGTYTEQEYILYQLEVATRVLDDVSAIFERFSGAEIEADRSLEKINMLTHEYEKSMNVVPREGERLHQLMRSLLSQTENYLVYFKNTNRENPEINAKIIEIKMELNQEMMRLKYLTE